MIESCGGAFAATSRPLESSILGKCTSQHDARAVETEIRRRCGPDRLDTTCTIVGMHIMIIDHSILIACIAGASFFVIFYVGAVALGRERIG